MKTKVLANSKFEIKKTGRSNNGIWLNKAIKFKSDLYLNTEQGKIAEALFNSLQVKTLYKLDHKIKVFQILIANLLYQQKKPIRISLNSNEWKLTRYNHICYNDIDDFVKVLFKERLIGMKKGFFNVSNHMSKQTRLFATKELLDIFPEYKQNVLSKPTELVILYDNKKKLKEYKDTHETRRIRAILERINEVNNKADIRYKGYQLHANLIAIFKERFTWYGRLHTRGFRHYQGFSSEEREEITIDGETVIEKDYSGLHPNLLYAMVGIQCEKDPYAMIDERIIVRKFLKAILVRMINSKSKYEAKISANNWFCKQSKMYKNSLDDLGIINAETIIEKIMEIHKPIAHYLCSGKETGMRLMNKDSKIALDVIDYFAKKNVPILTVHDSFIVQNKYSNELENIMKTTYKKHTGFNIKIKAN